jgi:bacteriocin biosynthesis cyclodehydratase domain-containing protein
MDDPRLAPGLRVVRRGTGHLQVGLYAGRRLVLPRTPVVTATLEALLSHRSLDDGPDTSRVLDRLLRAGCLTERDASTPPARRVAVLGSLPGADPTDLLSRAGITRTRAGEEDADAALVLSRGEVARDRLDPLLRRHTAHLVVRLVDGGVVLGPFVVPGETACLRCVDAHQAVRDPAHVAVTARYVRATSRARADGVPDVTDPLLTTLALTWAVRDLAAHLGGHRPSTWSRTVFLDADPARNHQADWPRHPGCGCCWDAHAPLSGTMGA